MWLTSLPFSWIADWLISSGKLSASKTKKLMQTIGTTVPALCLIGLSYAGCDRLLATVLLCVCVGVNSAVYSGYQGNHMDIAPNYAGTLMGISNMMANFAGFITPYVAGLIINGNVKLFFSWARRSLKMSFFCSQQTQAAWRQVFFISSGVYVCLNLVFVIFGSTKVQPWNTYWEKEPEEATED